MSPGPQPGNFKLGVIVMVAWLTQVLTITLGGFVGYCILIALGNKHRANMVRFFVILMAVISTLEHAGPAIGRVSQDYKEVHQDVSNLTSALNTVGNTQDKVNTFTGDVGTSPIINFGANAKLPGQSITEIFSGGHLEWPVAKKVSIAQGFALPDHHGIDIAVPSGTPILAPRDGWVREAGVDPNGIYGNYVLIDHGGGFQTLYAHCSELQTKRGKNVFAKDVIALSGSTGNSTGPHLHFEVRYSGKAVDPMIYLKK